MSRPQVPKPDAIRTPSAQWGWIDGRFKWFWDDLSQAELLLYFFLVTTSDAQGCSWWSTRKICKILKIGPATLIKARHDLEQRMLIATTKDELSQRIVYQVLPLPIDENVRIEIPIKTAIQKKPAAPQSADDETNPLALSVEQIASNVNNVQRLKDLLK